MAATSLPIARQVHVIAGLIVLTGTALAYFVHPAFLAITAFVGLGLLIDGLTGFCGMTLMLRKMPWNRA